MSFSFTPESGKDIPEYLRYLYTYINRHEQVKKLHYKAGTTLFKQGETPKGIYLIEKGKIKTVNKENTTPAVIRLVGSYDFSGIPSLILDRKYTETAEVLESTEVWFLPKKAFLYALQNDPVFTRDLIHLLCEQLAKAEEHIEALKTKNVRQRLAALLLSLQKAYDEDDSNKDNFIRLKRKDMAEILGVTPETLSRQLTDFKNEKLIRIVGTSIQVTAPKELIHIADLND